MPKHAIWYITAVVSIGAAAVLQAALNWKMEDPRLFFGLLVLTGCLSTMKIKLPGMTGTMSAGFVPVLAAIALLGCGETVVMAGASALVQSLWRVQSPRLVQVAFNAATLSISAWGAYQAAHWSAIGHGGPVAVLGLAAATDYMLNSFLVAGVLCLVESKSLMGMFSNCNLWALPYYIIGAVIASMLVSLGFTPGWLVVIPALPILWAVYDGYRQYVAAMVCEEGQA